MKISQDLRLKAGYTGLHSVQLGATMIFLILREFLPFLGSGHRLYKAVTSWSQNFFALQVSRDDNKGLKWLFFDLLN